MIIYLRLCLASFTLGAIAGAWTMPLSRYADRILGFDPWQIGLLVSATSVGAMIGPFIIGPIADRYFPAQTIAGVLYFFCAIGLFICGWLCIGATPETQPSFVVLMALLSLAAICVTPTVALLNSIVFKHLRKTSDAPYVFIFGPIGWSAASLFIDFFCGGATNPNFFFVGGVLGIFMAIYCMTLPHTPPKGAPAPGKKSDVLGLGALKLLNDRGFLIFVTCVFLAIIPANNYYFSVIVPYLMDSGYDNAIALTTINQFSELLFTLLLPFLIVRFGLKNMLIIGMAAWALRYFLFMLPTLAIPGLLLHGLATFLSTAAYIYAERKAPEELKASVQCFMVFLLIGIGPLIGGQFFGLMFGTFASQVDGEMVRNYQMIFGIPAVCITVVTILFFFLAKDTEKKISEAEKESG